MREWRCSAAAAITVLYVFFVPPCGALSAQELVSAHRGAILALIPDAAGNRILSVGEDGFLVEWDRDSREAVSRFQLSPYATELMALSPDGTDIAVVETDDLGLYRVSAWELNQRRKRFTLRFKDPISYIAYSAGGSFLIIAREAREGVSLINAKTGVLLPAPPDLAGPVSFAATGKSERTMITYSSVGLLSYWDVYSGAELKRVDAPAALASPTLFGNNRYFGGLDEQGLVIIDAVTGLELSRSLVSHGAFAVSPSENSTSLLAVAVTGSTVSLQELAVPVGELPPVVRPPKLIKLPAPASAVAGAGAEILIGLRDGKVATIETTVGNMKAFSARRRIRLNDAAVSEGIMVAVSEKGIFHFPSDPADFKKNATLTMIQGWGEDRALAADHIGDRGNAFLLWKADASIPPSLYDGTGSKRNLDIPTGVPFRSASVRGDRALFLDATGAITIASLSTGKVEFSFASLGILDAVLSADGRVLAGKSRAVAPKVPLLSIDSVTGETVPIDIGGTAIVRLYRGASGAVYAIVADSDNAGPKTSIVKLDFSTGPRVTPLVEYRAEDVQASIAENLTSIATTLGGDGATLVRPPSFTAFERTDALPQRLTTGEHYFIAVDSDGGICWHDPITGKAEAVLHIYEEDWEMERNGSRVSGPVM